MLSIVAPLIAAELWGVSSPMKRVPLDWASMLTLCLFAQAASYSRKDTLVLGRYFFQSCRRSKHVRHAHMGHMG